MKKNILCVIGKSGSGKSTIIDILCKDNNYNYVRSYTTRQIRKDDANDVNTHIFVTPNDFYEDLINGRIITSYVSPNRYINWNTDDLFLENKINVLAIDPKAFTEMIDLYGNQYNIYGIYVYLPEDIRKERIEKRGDKYMLEPHLSHSELKWYPAWYDVVDNSSSPEDSIDFIKYVIKRKGLKCAD